jgi:hypothetical protein
MNELPVAIQSALDDEDRKLTWLLRRLGLERHELMPVVERIRSRRGLADSDRRPIRRDNV